MKHLKSFKKIFESYPPNDFIIDSEKKFKRLISDINDILIVLSDDDIKYDVNKYIDDNIFELQVDIETVKTKEEKQLVGDTILRLNDFLESNDLWIQVIRMNQHIIGKENEPSYWHDHEVWSDEALVELQDFESSAGEISLEVVFGKHSYN
jgi:hypothetical protein